MAALNDEVKLHIVKALACYDTPTQVVESVKQEFKLEVTRQQVSAYDPDTVNGKRMSEKLKVIFKATREKFVEDVSEIPIANQAYRLRTLNRMLQAAESNKNGPLAAQLLEQAAKEVGQAFTNKRELTGRGGKDLVPPPPPNPLAGLTPDQVQTALREAASKF